jgi:hypothetical protein
MSYHNQNYWIFLDFLHRPVFCEIENTSFRKLDLFPKRRVPGIFLEYWTVEKVQKSSNSDSSLNLVHFFSFLSVTSLHFRYLTCLIVKVSLNWPRKRKVSEYGAVRTCRFLFTVAMF